MKHSPTVPLQQNRRTFNQNWLVKYKITNRQQNTTNMTCRSMKGWSPTCNITDSFIPAGNVRMNHLLHWKGKSNKKNIAKTTNTKVHFSRREGWFKVQMRLQRCGMCLISALINTNIEAMKGNMEGNSAVQPLLTWSKMRGSLFNLI